jgi:hypothetical protein
MKQIKEYKVLVHSDQTQLMQLVNEAIKEGWQPQGGISVPVFINSLSQETIFFAQAVVK